MLFEDYRSQAYQNKLLKEKAELRTKQLIKSMKPNKREIIKLSREVEKLKLRIE